MDDDERRLRESMASAVDGWTPGPMVPRARPVGQPWCRLGLAVAIVVLLAGGGMALGIGLSGSKRPSSLAAAPLVTPSESPTPGPSPCGTPNPVPTDSYAPLADATSAYASTICFDPEPPPVSSTPVIPPTDATAEPAVSLTPLAAPRADGPSPSASPKATTCTANDLTLTVTTDKASYVQTSPVRITPSLTVVHPCLLPYAQGEVDIDSSSGDEVGKPCDMPPGSKACVIKDFFEGSELESAGHQIPQDTFTWDMVTDPAEGNRPTAYASAGADGTGHDLNHADYTVIYTYGAFRATTRIRVVPPPDCQALSTSFTSDSTSYAPGSVATFTGRTVNAGSSVCGVDPRYSYAPIASDLSGSAVWSSGAPAGQDFPPPVYSVPPQFPRTIPVLPGQPIPRANHEGLTTDQHTWTWQLARDGTKDQPKAGPLPAGTYTVFWRGDGTNGQPVSSTEPINTVSVTITG